MWISKWKGVITEAALKPVHEILLRTSVDTAVHGNSSKTSELQLWGEQRSQAEWEWLPAVIRHN